jgi:amidophosphoribosyltransferase
MPTRQELIAYNRSEDQVAKAIGADVVIYQEMADLVASVSKFNPEIKNFGIWVLT